MPGVIEGIDEAGAVLDGLAVSSVDDLSDRALTGALAELEHHRRVLDAAVLHLVAEADDRRVCDRTVGLATSTWISQTGRQSYGLARRKVVVARAMASHFDEIDLALVRGEIGFEHAWVVVSVANPRIVEALAGLQGQILDLVAGRTFAAWRREVEKLAALLDDERPAERDGDPSANRLTLRRDPNGTMSVRGVFVGSWAETVAHVIPAIADQLLRRFQADRSLCPELELPDHDALQALALEEACRRAMACDLDHTGAPGVDATIVIPAGPPADPLDPSPDPQARWPAWIPGGHAESGADGVTLLDDALRLLACDPILFAVIVDELGQPLDVGSAARFANRHQRRAAKIRDGGRAFPGCGVGPTWVDLHHVVAFPEGPTELSNLVCLCRHHHRVTHRLDWTMTAIGDGWFLWTTPGGQTLTSQRHQRAGP